MASPAMAGTYLNGEVRSAFPGGTYTGSIIETHVGQEFELDENGVVIYAQAGPAFVVPDEGDSETELSGKIGVEVVVFWAVGVLTSERQHDPCTPVKLSDHLFFP